MSLADTPIDPIVDQLPKGLLDRIVAHLNPQKVILFGSRAIGNTHEDSDWDVLVVVDDDIPRERLHWRAVHEARRGIRGAIDLIPFRASTFLDRLDIVGSLPWIAANKGVVVYERQKAR
jgi:predicted nucleotidyltransferase